MSDEWNKNLMVHDWPEMGPGSLSLEELYQMFKFRMELEANHKETCALRTGTWDKCDCKPVQP